MLALGPGTGVNDLNPPTSFWNAGVGQFWNEAAFNVSPNRVARLMSVAKMQQASYTFGTSTSNAPGTVTLSDGTLGYGAHNLLVRSEELDFGSWGFTQAGQTVVIANATADPAGTTNADRIGCSAYGSVLSAPGLYQPYTYLAATYTLSAYFKAGTYNYVALDFSNAGSKGAVFNLATSSIGYSDAGVTAQIIPIGNGWYRCAITAVMSAGANYPEFYLSGSSGANTRIWQATGSEAIYAWGIQLNRGGLVDYVATGASAIYAPRITYDRGASSNFAYNTEDCSLWAGNTGVTASGLSFTETVANTVHQASQTAAGLTGTFVLTAEVKLPPSRGIELLAEHAAGGHYIRWTAAGVSSLISWGTPTGTAALQEAYFLPDGYLRLTLGVTGASATFTTVILRAIDNAASETYAGSTSAAFLYRNFGFQRAQYRGAYLRTTSTAPLYTAGTPTSQNLANGSATQSVTVLPGCVYSILHQSGGTYTLSGATTGTTTAGTTTTFVASTSTLTLTASSTPTLLQVWEGTGTMAYVAGPYSLYPQKSLLHEPARTRETLQPRDLTQAAWNTTANITRAKTATGIDGVANSATTLTATAGSYTSLISQSVTSASANRLMTMWVRARSASSLTIRLTIDSFSSVGVYTIGPQWQQIQWNQTARTNPVYGINLQNNGDSIDVDFVQGEQYTTLPAVPPMPIWGTESAAQTLSADLIRPPTSYINDTAQTTAIYAIPYDTTSSVQSMLVRTTGSGGYVVYQNVATPKIDDATNSGNSGVTVSGGVPYRVATRYSGSGIGATVNGAAIGTGSFDGTMGQSGATVGLGDNGQGSNGFWGEFLSLEIASVVATDTQLQQAALGLLP